MYTRCPRCESWFLVRAAHLRAAAGRVSCGRCGERFDALASLRDEPPAEEVPTPTPESAEAPALTLALAMPAGAADTGPEHGGDQAREAAQRLQEQRQAPGPHSEPTPPAPNLGQAGAADTGAQEEAACAPEGEGGAAARETGEDGFYLVPPDETPPAPPGSGTDGAAAGEAPVPASVPQSAEAEGRRDEDAGVPAEPQAAELPPELAPGDPEPAGRRWPWAAAAAVLVLALAGQLAWFNLDTLAAGPAMRPWLERACALAGCRLPARRDPGAFVVRERALVAHPRSKGVLRFTAVLVNGADFAQPPPVLELSLSDLEGRLLGARRFRPEEYLAGGAVGPVPPGGTVAVRLDLVDPGGAVSFRIRFL